MNSTTSDDLSCKQLAFEAAKCIGRLGFENRNVISFVLFTGILAKSFGYFQKTCRGTHKILRVCTRSCWKSICR